MTAVHLDGLVLQYIQPTIRGRTAMIDRSRERHVSGRSLFGSNQAGKPCGTTPSNGRSVFEANHPSTGSYHMTITIHYLRFAIFGDGVLKGFSAKVCFHAVREPPSQNLSAEPIHDGNWAADKNPHIYAISETALGHKVGTNLERTYQRSDFLEARRELLCDWAAYLADSSVIS